MAERSQRRPTGAVTIRDVARAVGVSTMTVSRVLNGGAHVRPSTRAAIERAIAALGYAPNAAARSLAGVEPVRIGLLYSNPSAGFLSALLVGALDQASRANVQLSVKKCSPDQDGVETAERFIGSGLDAVILPSPFGDLPRIIAALDRAAIPAVAVATGKQSDLLSIVHTDDYNAALTMTRHIIGLGHRRIGFIIGNPVQMASRQRLDGYKAGLAEAGLPVVAELIAQGYFSYRSGLDAAEALLGLGAPPSAIFASNDDMAAATIAVAHRLGLDVPSDLTVCGFDDTELATAIWPELTTIHQPIGRMAAAGVQLLSDQVRAIRAGERPRSEELQLDFTLIRRQSDSVPRLRPRQLPRRAAAQAVGQPADPLF